MLSETQIRHLVDTTPLWYDTIAALADHADYAGMSDETFLALVAGACTAETTNRGIAWAIDAGIVAWRAKRAKEQRV